MSIATSTLSLYQQYIHKSRYARYLDKEKRREGLEETVDRYFDFFQEYLLENHKYDISPIRKDVQGHVLNLGVMPSMRGLMTAGVALKRDLASIFNCAFAPIDNVRTFDEAIYILMLGTGDGFSVESSYTSQIPTLPDEFHTTETTIVFEDSKLGWAKGFREYVSLLMNGQIPKYDVSKVRGKGERLKTFGGRASGPEPLVDLIEFTKMMFIRAAGRKLLTIECHDLFCKIAMIVVVGGVRRSSTISLSDLDDSRMRDAKTGAWYNTHDYRRMANNSAVYNEKPTIGQFMNEWMALYESKSGERGMFSRSAVKNVIKNANAFRVKHFGEKVRQREWDWEFGTNPCAEIILRPYQFCNLTSIMVKPEDTVETLKEKVRIATIMGTWQSCLSKFRYLNKKWQKNTEDERLLGVSLGGVFCNKLTNGTQGLDKLAVLLEELKLVAIKTNIEWADKLGIAHSTAITCVKPDGTVSQFCGGPSGLHPAHSEYYIRYVRNDIKDPLSKFMIDNGFPFESDAYDPINNVCFKFPIKSAEDAIVRKQLDPIDHLNIWLVYQKHWAEHKPSVSISVREDRWLDVAAWVYKNFDWMSGVSFFPEDDHIYKQAPFTDCSKSEYEELLEKMPKDIDWNTLIEYDDETTGSQTYACTGATGCSI